MSWATLTLDELCDINVGRTPARREPRFWGSGEPWLSIADMGQGRMIRSTTEQITPAGAAGGRQVDRGTVLLSFKLSIGKVARAGMPLYTNEAIAALPVKRPDLLDEAYLCRALESLDLALGSNRAAMGRTLNKAQLKQIQIPVPPLAEQRRIAAVLDHVDAIRAKRRQVLAHLDSLTQAIFIQMFGKPDAATDEVAFGSICDLSGGRSLVADDSAVHSDYRVLKISAVTTGRFKPYESKPLPRDYVPPKEHLVREGDLLMSRANTADLVGAVAHVGTTPPNLALPDKVWRFKWKIDAEPIFYHALLSSPVMRGRISRLSSGTGGSMKNISKSKLAAMPMPSVTLDSQRAFVARARRVADQHGRVLTASARDADLFLSLQTRAFKGQL